MFRILQRPIRERPGPAARSSLELAGHGIPMETPGMSRRPLDEIWESIVAAPDSLPLPEAQRRELERRLKLHQEDPEAAQSWESVRSRLLRRE